MLAEATAVPDWMLAVVGTLVGAGIIATISMFTLILQRLTRIETKMEAGEERFQDNGERLDRHSRRIRDLERVEDKRSGRSERTGGGSEGALKPGQA